MSAREDILAAVRRNAPAGDFPLPPVTVYPIDDGGERTGHFLTTLASMGGKVLSPPAGDADAGAALGSALRATFPDAAVTASAVPEVTGNRDLAAVARQRDLDDVDVAVVRARLAVAETGSVLFAGDDLVVNSVAYLAQHLVVLVDPADIVSGLQDAYLHPDFGEHAYLVFHSGPSATADIEGVLIHGAQGVRSLHVALVPRG